MYNRIRFSFFSFLIISLAIGLTSCGDELAPTVDTLEIENFNAAGLAGGELAANSRGANNNSSCATLVYPISIMFEDGSVASFEDRETLQEGISAYKEANPDAEGPSLVYPITVIIDEVETEVASAEEHAAIKEACRGDRNKNDRGDRDGNREGNRNSGSCYDLVYPLTIAFEDGMTATYEDRATMREGILAYKEANPDAESPTLVFPITITIDDVEMEVASEDELAEIKEACQAERGDNDRGDRGDNDRDDRDSNRNSRCFDLVYPLTYTFADGTTQTFEDRVAKSEALQVWREENGRDAESPVLAYPVTVEYEDGTQATADSEEALDALKEACSDDEGDDDNDDDDNG